MTVTLVSRAIGGIGLNGNEYLLDKNGTPMEFDSKEEAEKFLVNHGVFREDLYLFDFEKVGDDNGQAGYTGHS